MSEITAETVPNQYIVVFKQHISEDVRQAHCEWAQTAHGEAATLRAESGGLELTGVGEQFDIETLSGYVGCFDEDVKNEIEAREEVAYVEPDYVISTSATVVQKPVPSWGLARISSNKKLPSPLPKDLAYEYDSTAGAGTFGYILDTGILTTHEDFGGRAKWGVNLVPGSSNTDKTGHGTHVAGTVGGTKYGLAKKCTLIAVKVLGDTGSGATSGVIKGVEWAVRDAKTHNRIKKSVANMSLGGGFSQAMNSAVDAAVRAGLTVAVSAGNSNIDSKTRSPASAPLALTTGSIDPNDTKSSFSNWGKCVDIFAPGRDITSCGIQPGNKGTSVKSGTSMAAPHITGLSLTFIARNPSKFNTPAAIARGITDFARKNSKVVPPVPAGTTTLIGWNGL